MSIIWFPEPVIMDVQIASDGSYLSLLLSVGKVRFHAVWLRDNARDEQTLSSSNGQRLITLLDQPEVLTLKRAFLQADETLCLYFSGDENCYEYPLSWLEAQRYDKPEPVESGWTEPFIQCWDSQLQNDIPTASFPLAQKNEHHLAQWLANIKSYGFAVMTELPDNPEALLEAVELFGFVRETNYGRFFEVRSEINPVNLAYTNRGLQAHTDNPYRDPVPTLQILSCIENTTEGGESIVVDGFKVAGTLQQESPEHFDLLARYCVRFEYAGSDDVVLRSKRPMIELNPDGELISIRFNNRSAAPFTDIPFDQMQDFYLAYRHFAEILERPENKVSFKLQPNTLFIVDNTRVMHSRNAFYGKGSRWLRGCYADKDSLLSTLTVLENRISQGSAHDTDV